MKYHFIGINGSSMSGLAQLMFDMGNEVTGCDIKKVKSQNEKIKTFVGHSENHIADDLDGIIVTAAAMHENSPAKEEIEKAAKLSIPIILRSKMIGRLMSNKIGISVAGMHGKTTVSTMLSLILEHAGLNPTALIGSSVKEWGTNYKLGRGKYFIAETCEYERQMLDFRPKIAIITNIEEEHLDSYPGGIKEIKHAFKKFIKLIPSEGLLLVNGDDKNIMSLIKSAKCKVKTYSKTNLWKGLKLKVPGLHNLMNATAAAKIAHELGVEKRVINEALNGFTGAERRFEIKGVRKGVTVIDDYGHHPTEIKATIEAAREKLKGQQPTAISHQQSNNKKSKLKAESCELKTESHNLIMVFQPHQYKRTKLLFKEFTNAFHGVDKLIISDIYIIPGREPLDARADFSADLVEAIKKQGVDAKYIPKYEDITKELNEIASPGDIIVTEGATDIYKVGEEFIKS